MLIFFSSIFTTFQVILFIILAEVLIQGEPDRGSKGFLLFFFFIILLTAFGLLMNFKGRKPLVYVTCVGFSTLIMVYLINYIDEHFTYGNEITNTLLNVFKFGKANSELNVTERYYYANLVVIYPFTLLASYLVFYYFLFYNKRKIAKN